MANYKSSNQDKQEALASQISLRIQVFQKWLTDGGPPEEAPTSLAQVRRWEDKELGIARIGSPSSFVRTHRKYGGSVKEIERLLERLNERHRGKSTPPHVRLRKQRAIIDEMKSAVGKAADQYVVASIRLEKCEKELRIATQKIGDLTRLLNEQREIDRTLKKELAKLTSEDEANGKVKQVNFRRPKR